MFTAKNVMELREMTGAGMMDCKKALTACDGDMEKAKDFLREKGLAAAAKKAGRIAAEGVVGSCLQDSKIGVLVEVNCETDFVAKTDDFNGFVKTVAAHIAGSKPCDEAALMAQTVADEGKTIDQLLNETVARIGEKIHIRRFTRYELGQGERPHGVIDTYIHMGGKIGVLLEMNCVDAATAQNAAFKGFVHDVALHIAAAKPTYVAREDISPETVEYEMNILRAQIKAEDKPKPDNIIEKMMAGRIEKFYKEVCLLEQPCVKNTDMTITQMLNELGKKLGDTLSVARFTRFEMGEGLQKRKDNFADEVMSQVKS
ncbi:MAG: translation elongation factor Ts [Clostridiales bacterium]|jgi:elongation factor Ts|nr:translation elongation factor Ts [Clostridiales bacterium]